MLPWLGLLARLVVGVVWIVAGVLKLPHPDASITAVRAYQILPAGLATTVGQILPVIEVVVGVMLVLGLFTRVFAIVSGLLLIAFIIGIASVWVRGISINCGCFGDGGYDPNASAKYPMEIARDVGLLLLSGLLAWKSRTRVAFENLLFPQRERVRF